MAKRSARGDALWDGKLVSEVKFVERVVVDALAAFQTGTSDKVWRSRVTRPVGILCSEFFAGVFNNAQAKTRQEPDKSCGGGGKDCRGRGWRFAARGCCERRRAKVESG